MDAKQCAIEVVRTFVRHGYIAYFAGGWVRDYLMGNPSSDIDIATDAPPQVILDLFPNSIIVGLAFGVVIVVVGGYQFEVATFRRDMEYLDGRKPSAIVMSTPEEDAKRRDFTINGMFYDPLEEVIYDYVGGKADLKRGIIRTIGDASERFIEDRLRMIRAVRFATRFGFAVDIDTQEAIIENANTLFPAVAMERIWQELTKMADSDHFGHALVELHRLKLLSEIFPQLEKVHLNDIKRQVRALEPRPLGNSAILALMVLFPNATLEEKLQVCKLLRTSNKDAELVELQWRCCDYRTRVPAVTKLEWVYFYAHPKVMDVIDAVAATLEPIVEKPRFKTDHEERLKVLHLHIENVIRKTPVVAAAHLLARGIQPGRQMGQLLRQAEALAIELDILKPEPIVEMLIDPALKKIADQSNITEGRRA